MDENFSMRTAFPCITAGADLVQTVYKAVEILDSIDSTTPIYGIEETKYHHIYGIDEFP